MIATQKILVSSSESVLTAGLRTVLRQTGRFELLPPCQTLSDVLEQLAEHTPAAILMDLTPEVTFSALESIRQAKPGAQVVLWTNTISTELAFQAMQLGVRGILRKSLPAEMHLTCLDKVCAGDVWFEKSLVDGFIAVRRTDLTRREAQLVGLLAQGMKNRDIATFLMVSEGTVKVYLTNLFRKVGVKDRFELALFGLKYLAAGPVSLARIEPARGRPSGAFPGPTGVRR